MSSRSPSAALAVIVAGLAFNLAHPQVAGKRTALDCARALRAWSDDRSFYRPTPAESKWRDGMLVKEAWSASLPAPDWCTGPFELPARVGYEGAMICRSIYGNEADRAKGQPGEAGLRRKADAFQPVFTERLRKSGLAPHDASVLHEMQATWDAYADWDMAEVDKVRAHCDRATAEYAAAREVEDYMKGGEFFTDRCLAVVMTETEAGRWNSLDPDIRNWALENEKRPYDARTEPYGACYTRWTPAMSYSRADVSLFEVAPLDVVVENIQATRNLDWAARAFALAGRRTDTASRAALDDIRLSMSPEFYAATQTGGGLAEPKLETLANVSTVQVLALISATRDENWQRAVLDLLEARTDLPSMVATADFLSGTRLPVRDTSAAVALYQRAASGGSAYGALRVGVAHLYGFGVARDVESARRLIADAAALGNAEAALKLKQLPVDNVPELTGDMKAEAYTYWRSYAAARMDFVTRCGYIPPDEQHEWSCGT